MLTSMALSQSRADAGLGTPDASSEKVKMDNAEIVIEIKDVDNARLAELGYRGEFRREFSVCYTPCTRVSSI